MIDNTITDLLRTIYRSMAKVSLPDKGADWASLGDFGISIRNEGVDYKTMGYEKLSDFVSQTDAFFLWTDFSGQKPVKYIKEKRQRVYTDRKPSHVTNVTSVDSEEVERIKRRLRLDNNEFIGQFSPSKSDGWFKISDIRNSDFTKIEDKERGVKNLMISFKSYNKDFNKFAYYKFTWVLLASSPLKFGIDLKEEITPVYPKDIVNCLYDGIMRYSAGAAKKITRSLDTLKKQLTQSGKEVFIYELLQNANDYPRRERVGSSQVPIPVEVEFHITDNFLTFQHTGDYFNPKNIAAICDLNDGEKSDNTEAIGYKGIGFKTVFLDNDYVFLNTGNYSFRFDKSATDVINTPWQILPIWTDSKSVDYGISEVFKQHPNDRFRVKFALRPRDKDILTDRTRDDNYISLFNGVFDSERVILFIPNIKKVSIFVDGEDTPIIREKDNNDWCVSDSLVDEIPKDITEKINEILNNPDSLRSDGYEKIPEKYLNFKKTAIKFACKREGRKLKEVEDSVLYCYLPAKRADWGFKFLMNTDMVPNGQRDDIEDIELNHVIARIAGRQFFWWIKKIIDSEQYDLDTVFALIPDFDECKKRRTYKTFIEEFQEEFETLIKKEPFVPTIDMNGAISKRCINEIVNDMSGMTANAVISDKDFLSLLELENYSLPINELRSSNAFSDFIYKHSPSDLDIEIDDILNNCESEEFQDWLTDVENNARFIKFWLSENKLDKFANKNIFIEHEGELYKADQLYYDFDSNCAEIDFLRCYIPHLCQETRDILESEQCWFEFKSAYFKKFEAAEMITSCVIPDENAMLLLGKLSNSVSFYQYLADKEVDLKENNKKIPFITEDGAASTDYEDHLYFYSDEAFGLTNEIWLGSNKINVLSHAYLHNISDEIKGKLISLFEDLGVIEFDKPQFITTIIANDINFRANINIAIENNYVANKAFVDYVYSCSTMLKENNLIFKDYILRCVDINGSDKYLCNDDVRYFNQDAYAQNSTYLENIDHTWLTDNMMYSLSNAYFDSFEKEEAKKLESFLRQQFGIKTFTDKSFFTDVVIKAKNKAIIYNSIVDEATMLSFIEYLKRDSERIFDDTMSFNDIKDMPLLCYDGTVLKSRNANTQYLEHNDDAILLFEKEWCPENFVVLSKSYTEDFSSDMRQLFKIAKFDINNILNTILSSASLKLSVNSLEQSVDFWRWAKNNQKHIASFEQFNTLLLLDKNNAFTVHSELYISDSYQQDKIESLVTRYVSAAQFVSSSYLESNSDNEKAEWVKLFKKLGLKSDNKDILFSDILPNLATFEEDSVVTMMTKHLKDLKDNWAEICSQIIQLRVKTRSGQYKPLNQVVIINVDEDSMVEPFKYITHSDEVHPDILKTNKELLLLISEQYDNLNLISTKQKWIEEKIKNYLSKFNENEDSVADFHIQFVRELAKIQSEYNIDINLRKQIKYRTKNVEIIYKYADELTLGTDYSPICDFEGNGVTELVYLSNLYIFEGNKDSIKSYFRGEGMHNNMTREDLKYLSIRNFACYFWTNCFSRRVAEYEIWIGEGRFENIICIPTENSVQKAELLYSSRITAGYAVRAKVPQWEEKVPCKAIVDKIENREARELFEKLNFCTSLSFEDCLFYLARVKDRREEESDYRRMVISWILTAPNHDNELIAKYRNTPTSMWRNGKGQRKHISQLYAIHPDAVQERNIFWGNEYVMQTGCFPSNKESFEMVCKILQIKCLVGTDFVATPIGKVDETANMIPILRPRLLVLAAIENPEQFQQIYERYNDKLSQYHFYVCEKIDLGYDTIHNDVMRIYNDDTHVYYVSSWIHNRTFTKFCDSFKKLVGCYVDAAVSEDVLDINNTIEACIAKYCSSLAYNEGFISYLKSLDLTIDVQLEEDEEITIDDDYYSDNFDDAVIGDIGGSNDNSIVDTENSQQDIITDSSNSSVVHVPKHEQNYPGCGDGNSSNGKTTDVAFNSSGEKKSEEIEDYDTYIQIDSEDLEDTMGESQEESTSSYTTTDTSHTFKSDYDPDQNQYMGSIDKDNDFQPIGAKVFKPRTRRHPKNYTKEEVERLRSHGTPLELESLPATTEEIEMLAQCNISPEQIADTNYLAQLRLYLNITQDSDEEPEESMAEFVRNADDVTEHKLKNGRYIHTCSAARGVMYIGPTIWNKMIDEKGEICVYLNGQGKNFERIKNTDHFLKLVEKDDVVIKITGEEKVAVVKALYNGLLKDAKGTAYTLIRVAARTNMDAVFAHYIGAMAEKEDGNEDTNEYGE